MFTVKMILIAECKIREKYSIIIMSYNNYNLKNKACFNEEWRYYIMMMGIESNKRVKAVS